MKVKFATLAVALMVLAGCGGGSDGNGKPTATPTPRTYTLEEMKAALPTADDVEGGLKVIFTCPDDKERCPDADPKEASVLISLSASSPELTEKQASVEVNVMYVSVRVDADETASKAEQAKRRKDDEVYEGAFDIPRKDLEEGRYVPGENGRGELNEASSGHFTGFRLDRTSDNEAQGIYLASEIDVRSGAASVTVVTSLGAEGRTAAEAEKLTDKVLAAYLKRLGGTR